MVMVTAVEVRIHRKSPAQIFHFHAAPLETITTTSSLCDLLQHHFLQKDSITVLVCNGKHQYRARDDLDAFLGYRISILDMLIKNSSTQAFKM
ncbi:hypothetical protein SCA6_012499 [Theobroma cacao]